MRPPTTRVNPLPPPRLRAPPSPPPRPPLKCEWPCGLRLLSCVRRGTRAPWRPPAMAARRRCCPHAVVPPRPHRLPPTAALPSRLMTINNHHDGLMNVARHQRAAPMIRLCSFHTSRVPDSRRGSAAPHKDSPPAHPTHPHPPLGRTPPPHPPTLASSYSPRPLRAAWCQCAAAIVLRGGLPSVSHPTASVSRCCSPPGVCITTRPAAFPFPWPVIDEN